MGRLRASRATHYAMHEQVDESGRVMGIMDFEGTFPDGHKISTISSQHKVAQRKVGKHWENGCI